MREEGGSRGGREGGKEKQGSVKQKKQREKKGPIASIAFLSLKKYPDGYPFGVCVAMSLLLHCKNRKLVFGRKTCWRHIQNAQHSRPSKGTESERDGVGKGEVEREGGRIFFFGLIVLRLLLLLPSVFVIATNTTSETTTK